MARTIELPDELYNDLEKRAQERGLSVVAWIAAALPDSSGPLEEHSLPGMLDRLIGAVDSTTEPPGRHSCTAFGDSVATKLRKQGLRRP